jgi:hypothetical protein
MGMMEPESSNAMRTEESNQEVVAAGKDFSNDLKGLDNDTRLKVGKSMSHLGIPFIISSYFSTPERNDSC